MPQFSRQLLLTHSGIFGNKLPDEGPYIRVVEKAKWAKIIARLNHLTRTRSKYTPLQLFSDWFGRESAEMANDIWDKLVSSYTEIGVNVSDLLVLNIWSNLTLYDKMLAAEMYDTPSLTNSETELSVIKLYLSINEAAADRTDKITQLVTAADYPYIVDRFARIMIALLFPYHDINHFKAIELLIVNFIKCYYCLQFLEGNYPDLLALFLAPYGVADWKGYLKGILPIAHLAAMPNDDSGLNYLSIRESRDKEKSRIFLDHLALVTEEEYKAKSDFVHARSHPLYKVDEDSYLIIDSVLAVNRLYNSMFFELLRISEKDKSLNLHEGRFFSVFTFDFIEKHLSYSLLDMIYNNSGYFNISGSKISQKYGVDTEPDYYARKGNKVFLYEIKGSIVTGPSKQSFKYPEIEKELKEKFLFDTTDNGNKAVKQLAERIKILFTKSEKSIYDSEYDPRNIRIFPILLVSEIMLTTPGINHLLNEWFQEEIQNDDVLRSARYRIHDLVILDLDTLILFSKEFEKDINLLKKLILDYNTSCSKEQIERLRKQKSGITPSQLEARIMSTLVSFGQFIRDKMKPEVPDLFEGFGRDLFADGRRMGA